MKNKILLAILAIALVFGMTACSNGGGGSDNNTTKDDSSSGGLVGTIVSEVTVDYNQAYFSSTADMNEAKNKTNFGYLTELPSNIVPLSKVINEPASVTVNNGKVTIKLGTPKIEYLRTYDEYITNSAKFLILSSMDEVSNFISSDGKYLLYCMKDLNNCATLIYTDRDSTIKEGFASYGDFEGSNSVSIKKGWNYFIVSINKAAKTITATSSTTLPVGFKWTVINWETLEEELL